MKDGLKQRMRRATFVRWLKFNFVGVIGTAVQLAALFGLTRGLHLDYLIATVLAVEVAVLHNFLWHERFTWHERVQPSWRKSTVRLLRFNATNGAISIAGNLILMKCLVGFARVNYLLANVVAVGVCAGANFLISENWIFSAETKNIRRNLPCGPG